MSELGRLRLVVLNRAEQHAGVWVLKIKVLHMAEVHFFDLKGKTFRQLITDIGSWNAGAFIQDVMPYLDADTREFFISGITPEKWCH